MKNLAYLNKYLWKYRGRFFMGFLFIILGNILIVYAPVVVGQGIDFLSKAITMRSQLSNSEAEVPLQLPESMWWYKSGEQVDGNILINSSNASPAVIQIGVILALMYIAMYLIKGVFLFYQRQTLIVMSRYIEYDLKNEIYRKYQELDASFYKKNRTGDLMNRISEDTTRVRMYLGPAIMYTLNLIVLIVMCVVVMLQIDVELSLYTLLPLPFMMIVIFYVSTIINKKTDGVQKQQSKLSSMIQESISGIRILKAFRRENYFAEEFEKESDDYRDKQLSLVKTEAFFMPVILLLVGLSTILTVYIGAVKVMEGTLTAGIIVQFVFYVNNLTWPFASVGWVTSLVQKAEASQARINEFLKAQPDIKNPTHEDIRLDGHIKFDNVSFIYPDTGIEALKNISFEIKPGQTIAITGRTGSGKSTIANLLVRMFDVTSGSISINNKDIRTMNLEKLRQQIGYVPQEVFLFSDSIRNNIKFGASDIGDEEIIQAAMDADVHSNIMGFTNGYDTVLGERGINISGGQKQRISIARAIAKKPEILVFDDCLSAVDTETEERILQSFEKIMAGKSSIIIAHRISAIKKADQILVLDKGKIVESGTHESLIAANGFYAMLYRKQQLEAESENQ